MQEPEIRFVAINAWVVLLVLAILIAGVVAVIRLRR